MKGSGKRISDGGPKHRDSPRGSGDEATLDLSKEVVDSYRSILTKPKRNFVASGMSISSSPSKAHISSSKAAETEQSSLPDYPASIPFDEQVLAKSQAVVKKAFENEFGWRAAFKEACSLELARAKSVYGSGPGKTVYEYMERLVAHFFENYDTFMQAATGLAPKQVPNPKNQEVAAKIQTLESLIDEYEKELADWQEVERTYFQPPTPRDTVVKEVSIPGEEEDAELITTLNVLVEVPSQVLRAIHTARTKLERAEQTLVHAERETADIITQYSQHLLGDEIEAPKQIIKSLTMDD